MTFEDEQKYWESEPRKLGPAAEWAATLADYRGSDDRTRLPARRKLIEGLMYLAYRSTRTYCRKGRIDDHTRSQVLSGAIEGLLEAIQSLADERQDIPADGAIAFCKTYIRWRMGDAYRECLPHCYASRYAYQNYRLEYRSLDERRAGTQHRERYRELCEHIARTDFEREILDARVAQLVQPNLNILNRVRETFPDATQRQVSGTVETTFKPRLADALGTSVERLERRQNRSNVA